MAFSAAALTLLKTSVGNGPNLWHYSHTDARATVEGAGYFAGMANVGTAVAPKGMKLGDTVIVVFQTGYVTTIHSVSSVDAANGNCTINAAVLA